ncbi:class I SAM-dependent methyltransferase [Bacillus sp. BGMRC 2118]|nr:class I SAM-dependent methyltransferase [Bacillus sp. BGMRC 2118]
MGITKVEQLFTVINQSATLLQEELQISYLEAVGFTGDNLFEGQIMQEDVLHNEVLSRRIENEYNSINMKELSKEEIRKGFQLAVLKGMKEATQAHHHMTPDAVALFIGYLVDKLSTKKNNLTILDPAVGTGNLLTAVMNHMPNKEVQAFGVEIDDLLVKLAFIQANLQEHHIELFKKDALQDLFIDPVDLVVCDLPVGYYPNDIGAKKFDLHHEEGHSFAHYLFIEQSVYYTKPGGKLIFLIPNSLFEGEQAAKLHEFIKKHAAILGMLQLPLTMFQKEQHAKSILILQKQGPEVKLPNQALLAELPSFSNMKAMEGMVQRIDQWFATENLS